MGFALSSNTVRICVASALIAVLGALMLLGAHSPAGAVPTTFTPEADAYVNEASPTTNYGANAQLRVDGSPFVNSYLRFNVQGLSGPAASATLRIFANSSQGTGFDVQAVADNLWSEAAITYNNAPPISLTVTAVSGPVVGGTWYDLDVTSLVTGSGQVNMALTTPGSTAISLASRESTNDPQLIVETDPPTPTPTPTATPTSTPTPTPTTTSTPTPTPDPTPPPVRLTIISRVGDTYFADAQWAGGHDYSGTRLKIVGESAIYEMNAAGGGTIQFEAGDFNFGTDYFVLHNIANMVVAGRGMDITTIRNSTNASTDTEPFNTGFTDFVTIRDMTVSAGGSLRTTSDALDFDTGNNDLVERVKVTASRARGIIFDGKGSNGQEANNNVIRDCIVSGTQSHGIQLLAADNNRIENCTISNVNGYGIQIVKSSSVASTPNEPSNDNVIIGNTIQNAAQDGINVGSSARNQILNNVVTGSKRDGIRLGSANSITCNDNTVSGNASTNSTQWGLNINSSLCNRTVVGPNTFSGNGSGAVRNAGTGTIYL